MSDDRFLWVPSANQTIGYAPNSLNLYLYALNNPLSFIDPFGLASEGGQSYLSRSLNQVILGNYTNNVTLLGTAGQFALGFAGVDLPADLRDVWYDVTHWENSWGHAGQTLLDAAAFIPVVGMLKYGDEFKNVIKIQDLKPLHSLEIVGNRADLRKLTDAKLLQSVTNPKNNDFLQINTKTGSLVDGNSRAYELLRRASDPNSKIAPDMEIPYKTYTPDNSMFWDSE